MLVSKIKDAMISDDPWPHAFVDDAVSEEQAAAIIEAIDNNDQEYIANLKSQILDTPLEDAIRYLWPADSLDSFYDDLQDFKAVKHEGHDQISTRHDWCMTSGSYMFCLLLGQSDWGTHLDMCTNNDGPADWGLMFADRRLVILKTTDKSYYRTYQSMFTNYSVSFTLAEPEDV